MYNATVTVFNYYESSTTGIGIWYPHVLSGVDLNTDKGAILKKYGVDSTDNASLYRSTSSCKLRTLGVRLCMDLEADENVCFIMPGISLKA